MEALVQPLDDVAPLVHLAALDQGRPPEGPPDRLGERLGAVEDVEPGPLRIEPTRDRTPPRALLGEARRVLPGRSEPVRAAQGARGAGRRPRREADAARLDSKGRGKSGVTGEDGSVHGRQGMSERGVQVASAEAPADAQHGSDGAEEFGERRAVPAEVAGRLAGRYPCDAEQSGRESREVELDGT